MQTQRVVSAIILLGIHSLSGLAYLQDSAYGGVGEGWTSVSESEGIKVAARMFTAPQLEDICMRVQVPATQWVPEPAIRLRVGDSFALNRLRIHALDREGRALGPLPIQLIVENAGARNLDLDALGQMQIRPLVTGAVRFRVQTICGDVSVEEIIAVTMVED